MAPTPVLLPGESQGRGSLVGCHLWGRTESGTTEATQQQRQQGYRPRATVGCSLVHLSVSRENQVQGLPSDSTHVPSCHPSVLGASDCLHLGQNLLPSQGKKGTWVPGSLTPPLPEIPSTFTQGGMVFGPLGGTKKSQLHL